MFLHCNSPSAITYWSEKVSVEQSAGCTGFTTGPTRKGVTTSTALPSLDVSNGVTLSCAANTFGDAAAGNIHFSESFSKTAALTCAQAELVGGNGVALDPTIVIKYSSPLTDDINAKLADGSITLTKGTSPVAITAAKGAVVHGVYVLLFLPTLSPSATDYSISLNGISGAKNAQFTFSTCTGTSGQRPCRAPSILHIDMSQDENPSHSTRSFDHGQMYFDQSFSLQSDVNNMTRCLTCRKFSGAVNNTGEVHHHFSSAYIHHFLAKCSNYQTQ